MRNQNKELKVPDLEAERVLARLRVHADLWRHGRGHGSHAGSFVEVRVGSCWLYCGQLAQEVTLRALLRLSLLRVVTRSHSGQCGNGVTRWCHSALGTQKFSISIFWWCGRNKWQCFLTQLHQMLLWLHFPHTWETHSYTAFTHTPPNTSDRCLSLFPQRSFWSVERFSVLPWPRGRATNELAWQQSKCLWSRELNGLVLLLEGLSVIF